MYFTDPSLVCNYGGIPSIQERKNRNYLSSYKLGHKTIDFGHEADLCVSETSSVVQVYLTGQALK